MVKKYTPEQGDIVLLDFNPTKGHEQTGFRPAVVLVIMYLIKIQKWQWYVPLLRMKRVFLHIIF